MSITKIVLAGLALPAFLAACASTDTAKDSSSPSSANSSQSNASASGTQSSNPSGSGMNGASAGMPGQRSVYYDFDKSDIKADQRSRIEANAKYLREHPEVAGELAAALKEDLLFRKTESEQPKAA